MRSKIIAALTASAVVSLFASAAAADVILDSFTATPNVVSVGDPFTLNLQFHVTADPGYSNFQITSGSEALVST
jgi:hypothetical protein